MDFSVAHALLAAGYLEELVVDLRLTLRDPLLDLRDLDATILHLALGLGSQPDRELPRVDLRLPADGLRLALRVCDEPAPLVLAAADGRAARGAQPHRGCDCSDPEPDDQSDQREHVHSSRRLGHHPRRRRGRSHPVSPRPRGASWL